MYADTVSSRATKFAKVTQLTNKHVLPSNIPPKPKGQGTIAPKFLGPATFQCLFQPVSHGTMRHKLVIASENEKNVSQTWATQIFLVIKIITHKYKLRSVCCRCQWIKVNYNLPPDFITLLHVLV